MIHRKKILVSLFLTWVLHYVVSESAKPESRVQLYMLILFSGIESLHCTEKLTAACKRADTVTISAEICRQGKEREAITRC